MTRCPVIPATSAESGPLPPRLALAFEALQWPELAMPCGNRHDVATAAVVEGTRLDGDVALCLKCACADGWFVADDGREMPDQVDVLRALDCLEAESFDGDVVGWPRPVWVRPDAAACPEGRGARGHEADDEGAPARRLPVPWINGESGLKGDFYSFRPDALRSVEQRLCAVCGNHMPGDIALGAMNGNRITSGGWCHPRCLAVAVRMCPHFTHNDSDATFIVGWRYRGPGVGLVDVELVDDPVAPCAAPLTVSELTEWARRDPWGHEGLDLQAACGCPPRGHAA